VLIIFFLKRIEKREQTNNNVSNFSKVIFRYLDLITYGDSTANCVVSDDKISINDYLKVSEELDENSVLNSEIKSEKMKMC
jgi:hypothetical protein